MDLIKKWDAIEALKAIKQGLWEIDIPHPGNCPEYVEHHKQIKDMMEITDGWIKRLTDMPSPPWIPCSERLPEKSGLYLVTNVTPLSNPVTTRYYNARTTESFWSGYPNDEVTAWMPLPKRYEGRSE